MGRKIDLVGQRFGRLIVIKESEPHYTSGGNRKVMWVCKCDCGNTISVSGGQLRNGATKSCGCYQIDRAKEANSKDLTGQKFGRLTVIERANDYIGENYKKHQWKCQCECGNTVIVRGGDLTNKRTKSCGCLKSEKSALKHRKHDLSGTRIDNILKAMKQRCYNVNCERYKDYGGRGIAICKEWLGEHGLKNFYDWSMTNGYADDLTIDRIDVNGNYEPSNCKWSTYTEQANNKRETERYEYNGETHTLSEWADITGLDYHMLKARVKNYGYTIKEAIEIPKYTRISKMRNRNNVDKE